MNVQFHLDDLSHGYGHPMLEWFPEFNAVGGDGIPIDPSYTPSVIPQHHVSEFGGKGSPTGSCN